MSHFGGSTFINYWRKNVPFSTKIFINFKTPIPSQIVGGTSLLHLFWHACIYVVKITGIYVQSDEMSGTVVLFCISSDLYDG